MTRAAKLAGLAGILALTLTAVPAGLRAGELKSGLREGQPAVTALGADASAITYWVGTPDGWHVVTTVDTVSGRESDRENHAVVRFSSVLLPGQSEIISVPGALGEPQRVLRIRRVEDRIEVAQVPASST